MSSQSAERISFDFLPDFPVVVQPSEGRISSDGGLLPLRQFDQGWNYTARMADCLVDPKPDRGQSLLSMLRQRIFGILAGYEDCNDHDTLRDDPVFKRIAGRLPEDKPLASQPTLSRFENLPTPAVLQKLIDFNIATGIERLKQKHGGQLPAWITLDLDATDDPTHGAQQLTFFNGHYDTWCYLPVAGFLTFNEEPDQYLFAYVLRPGNVGAGVGAIGILSRLLPRLRAAFPRARLRVRLDGGFAAAEMFAFLERGGLEYVVAMGKNKVLERRAARLMGTARRLSRESGETAHLYSETRYAAGTWDHRRRVIIKAEVVRHPGRKPKDNPRFVVTNLKHSPRHLYEAIYCARGDIENRIKELHHGLEIDRTSCSRFLANQLRGLLTAAAYVLYQELRLRAASTAFRSAQVSTLREHLMKLGAWVESTVRRIVLHLPATCLHRNDWQIIAKTLGAAPA